MALLVLILMVLFLICYFVFSIYNLIKDQRKAEKFEGRTKPMDEKEMYN